MKLATLVLSAMMFSVTAFAATELNRPNPYRALSQRVQNMGLLAITEGSIEQGVRFVERSQRIRDVGSYLESLARPGEYKSVLTYLYGSRAVYGMLRDSLPLQSISNSLVTDLVAAARDLDQVSADLQIEITQRPYLSTLLAETAGKSRNDITDPRVVEIILQQIDLEIEIVEEWYSAELKEELTQMKPVPQTYLRK